MRTTRPHLPGYLCPVISFVLVLLSLSARAGLQGYWTFDNTYNDGSGNARHAAAAAGTAAPIFSTDVPPQLAGAGAASLDLRNRATPSVGTNCYATVPGSGPWFNFTGPATVSCWVKGWPTDSWVPFIAKNGEANGWQIRRNGGTPEVDWTTRGAGTGFSTGNGDFGSNAWGWANAPGEASKQSRWQHYCATWDGTNKRIFINGQLAAVQTNAGATIQSSANLLVFGARDTGSISGHSRVMLDNVAIWDEALSQAQVDDLSRGGNPLSLRTTVWPYGAGEPWGSTGTLGVRMNKPAIVNGLHDVVNSMWNNVGTVNNTTATRLSFADPNSPGGALAGYTTYYNNTGVDDEYFGQVVTGCFRVPAGQGGQYTFFCNGDDGFQLVIFGATWEKFYNGNAQTTIGGEIFQAGLPTGASNAYGVVTLQPGDYNFRYTWFEQQGGAFNYVQAGPGDKSATDATFRVLGDPALFPLVEQKPMLDFRTSSDTVVAGVPANITLSWDNKFTTGLTLTPTPPGNPALTPGRSSITIPSPATTTTYTLTGTNGGQSTGAQVTVFVDQPPVINSFTISDDTVVSGAPVTLAWSVVGAQTLSIDNGVGAVTPLTTGTRNITAPASTTTYTLTAGNDFGSVTAQLTLTIGQPPVINSFTTDDSLVMPGGAAILHWDVSNADSRTISPRPGSVVAASTYHDTINQSTTYTLTAANVYAVVSQNLTVNVPVPIAVTPAGWNVRRVTSGVGAVATLATSDGLLNGTLAGTTFTQNGLPRINFGDSAVGVVAGGETLPPGGNGDNFVVECTATLQVNFPGSYIFGINNDDGGRLRIDGADVIVDDTNHGPTSFTGSKTLTAGTHTITYVFWEQTGGMAGECFWVRPDGAAVLLENTAVPFFISTADLVISEFQADNSETLEDHDGQASDWIEIYNGTASPVSLAGYYLTDDSPTRNKWAFPTGSPRVLQSGEYLVVFASAKDTTYPGDEYHTNFKLNDAGGYLALTKDDGAGGFTVVQQFNPYAIQSEDRSFGLYDTELRSGYFATPTPGGPNNAGYTGFVGDTHFDVHRGVKSAAFPLTITCDEPTAEIRYTTDGSTPTLLNGTLYTSPINITTTTVIRAAGFKQGWYPTNVDTHTYVFPADVLNQSQASTINQGWPVGPVAGQIMDYGMDTRITGPNAAAVTAGLQQIPSVAITTDLPNLLDPNFGVYVSSNLRGEQWERPASFEILNDSTSADNTAGPVEQQIDCGLRIRGGYSRSDDNPKHAFRLFFSRQYDGPLDYPLFGSEGATSFRNLDLQCPQNYSWSFDPGGAAAGGAYQANTFLRELSSRDTQRALGQPYTRTRHYHLYINGVYWGLFASQERAENSYGASYLGGDDDDYDVVKSSGSAGGYVTEATDGTMLQGTSAAPGSAWARLWFRSRELRLNATSEADRTTRYFQLQGLAADGVTPLSPATNPKVLDPDNLAEYLLVSFYCGSFDAPMSTFLNNASNNWFGMRDRLGTHGFKFFCHDFEHGMGSDAETSGSRSRDRTGPWGAAGTNYKNQAMYNTGGDYTRSNPHYVHEDLAFAKEYRVRFGDRAHRALFNGGALTNASVLARINTRAATLDPVIICESARWGDSKSAATPFTKNDWLNARTRLSNWINFGSNEDMAVSSGPGRTARIVQQLRAYKDKASGTSTGASDPALVAMPLYPLLDAPVYSQNGGLIPQGGSFTITNPNTTGDVGVIYYRLDELDPREVGGAIRAGSLTVASGGSVFPTQSGIIRARVYQTTTLEWSAMNEFAFVVGVPASSANIVVSEINYNPRGPVVAPATDRDNYEFIELLNISNDTVQLDGVRFETGITFDFTTQSSIGSLAPGARCVVVNHLASFQQRYPDASYPGLSAKIAGVYGDKLDNAGELLILRNTTTSQDIANFSYSDDAPWPTEADGNGKTIYLTCSNPGGADENLASSWYEHALLHGNPGGLDCGYELWALANGGSTDGAGDADGDGLLDVVEYMLGTSPVSSSSDKVPTASLQSLVVGMDPPANYLTMSVTRAPLTPDIQVIAETATALAGWNADAVLVSTTTNLDGSITRVFRAPVPFASDARRQMRVRVVKP
jgi:hypothetical protein